MKCISEYWTGTTERNEWSRTGSGRGGNRDNGKKRVKQDREWAWWAVALFRTFTRNGRNDTVDVMKRVGRGGGFVFVPTFTLPWEEEALLMVCCTARADGVSTRASREQAPLLVVCCTKRADGVSTRLWPV